MDERILKWLFDIRDAISEIDEFFLDIPKEFDQYRSNNILKRATERNLEIIGEAVNRILEKDPDVPIENAKRIVGLRNQIIHAYDNISDENIWGIITKHIPILQDEIESLIKAEGLDQGNTYYKLWYY